MIGLYVVPDSVFFSQSPGTAPRRMANGKRIAHAPLSAAPWSQLHARRLFPNEFSRKHPRAHTRTPGTMQNVLMRYHISDHLPLL